MKIKLLESDTRDKRRKSDAERKKKKQSEKYVFIFEKNKLEKTFRIFFGIFRKFSKIFDFFEKSQNSIF